MKSFNNWICFGGTRSMKVEIQILEFVQFQINQKWLIDIHRIEKHSNSIVLNRNDTDLWFTITWVAFPLGMASQIELSVIGGTFQKLTFFRIDFVGRFIVSHKAPWIWFKPLRWKLSILKYPNWFSNWKQFPLTFMSVKHLCHNFGYPAAFDTRNENQRHFMIRWTGKSQ